MLEVTTENFIQEVLDSDIPVVVDFWATWCVPCKMIAPILEEISKEYDGRCKVLKLNVDDAMGVATKFGVMNIPTVIFFKDGREFARFTGVVPKGDIIQKIKGLL